MQLYKIKVTFQQPEISSTSRNREYTDVTQWSYDNFKLTIQFDVDAEFYLVTIPLEAIERVEVTLQEFLPQ